MSEYNDLEKRISKIENNDIKEINSDIKEMAVSLERNNILAEQSIKANEKLSDTMDAVKDTMAQFTISLKENTKLTAELSKQMESMDVKITNTNERVDEKFNQLNIKIESVDDKGKVDIITWMKTNWFKIIMVFMVFGLLANQLIGVNPF